MITLFFILVLVDFLFLGVLRGGSAGPLVVVALAAAVMVGEVARSTHRRKSGMD